MLALAGRLCSDGDPAEERRSRHGERGGSRVVVFRSPGVDTAGESVQLGFHAPARRCLDVDSTKEGVQGQSCPGGELDLAEIEFDAAASSDPPVEALARLLRSMPSKTATRPSSSVSSSPHEGTARRTNAAEPIIPVQAPSVKG